MITLTRTYSNMCWINNVPVLALLMDDLHPEFEEIRCRGVVPVTKRRRFKFHPPASRCPVDVDEVTVGLCWNPQHSGSVLLVFQVPICTRADQERHVSHRWAHVRHHHSSSLGFLSPPLSPPRVQWLQAFQQGLPPPRHVFTTAFNVTPVCSVAF